MNDVHDFGLLLNEFKDILSEKEFDKLSTQWENEYREYLFEKVKNFKK